MKPCRQCGAPERIQSPGMDICQSCEWYAASVAEKVNASMKQETIAVPVELVRELKAWRMLPIGQQLDGLLAKLPDPPPPKPDVVEECRLAGSSLLGAHEVKRMLRRYRELGCPELDE